MRRVSEKFVQHVLTVEQKQQLLSISLELRVHVASDSSFLENVIIGDETWVYGHHPVTRVQSSQRKTPCSLRAKNKARQTTPNIKVMMIVFFDIGRIVTS